MEPEPPIFFYFRYYPLMLANMMSEGSLEQTNDLTNFRILSANYQMR